MNNMPQEEQNTISKLKQLLDWPRISLEHELVHGDELPMPKELKKTLWFWLAVLAVGLLGLVIVMK